MWITVKTYAQWMDAQADLLLLESEEIPARLGDGLTIQIDPLLSPALGGVKLQVPNAFAAQAMNLLMEKEKITSSEKQNILFKNTPWKLAAIIVFFVLMVVAILLFLFTKQKNRPF
jgi:hypothetical protein